MNSHKVHLCIDALAADVADKLAQETNIAVTAAIGTIGGRSDREAESSSALANRSRSCLYA